MVRIRRGWIVAGMVSSLALLGGACKKDEKKTDTQAKTDPKAGDTAVTAEKPAGGTNTPAPAGGAPTGQIADDLSLIPVDSELVMGLNFAQLQQSAMWKQYVQPQLMKGDAAKSLADFQAKCGFDPMTAMTSIALGMKNIGRDDPDGVVVIHGLDKTKTLACIDKVKEEAAKEGTTIAKDGDVITVKGSDASEQAAVMFVNDTTAVVSIGPNGTVDGVKKAATGGSALKSSPTFVEMYGKINTQSSLWFLMNGSAEPFKQTAAMGIKPKAVFGSINVTDGLAVDVRVRLESADQAAQMASAVKGQAAAVSGMVDKLDIVADGPDLKVVVALSDEKLKSLVQNFGSMLGGFGGM